MLPMRSRFQRQQPPTEQQRALINRILSKAAELEALFDEAYEHTFPIPELAQAGPETNDSDGPSLESFVGALDSRVEYFHDGMKALELAVMWTTRGMTA